MAHELRALACLPEDLVSISSAHMVAHKLCNINSRGPNIFLLAFVGVVHKHTCRQSTHKTSNKKFKKIRLLAK